MTPEELRSKIEELHFGCINKIKKHSKYGNVGYDIKTTYEEKTLEVIKQFKKEVCEKQRIKVAEAHGYKKGTIGYENIVDISEPK